MSIQLVERHVCDVCQTAYDPSLVGWMTITAPNVEGSNAFDFCGWDCLVSWVTSDEAEQPEIPEEQSSTPASPAPSVSPSPLAPAPSSPPAVRPSMTLADFIATGQADDMIRGRRTQ